MILIFTLLLPGQWVAANDCMIHKPVQNDIVDSTIDGVNQLNTIDVQHSV